MHKLNAFATIDGRVDMRSPNARGRIILNLLKDISNEVFNRRLYKMEEDYVCAATLNLDGPYRRNEFGVSVQIMSPYEHEKAIKEIQIIRDSLPDNVKHHADVLEKLLSEPSMIQLP